VFTKANSGQTGFTILECTIALVIMLVGVLAIEVFVVNGLGMQALANNSSIANSLAKAKVEELQARSSNDPARANGGSLTSNVIDYYDTIGANFVRRWLISTGADGTQNVQVRVLPSDSSKTFTTVTIETLIQ
jgi:Tfp pilus assembly protein PilV